jgi:hypothetical protein
MGACTKLNAIDRANIEFCFRESDIPGSRDAVHVTMQLHAAASSSGVRRAINN